MSDSADAFESAIDGLSELEPSERTPYFYVFEGRYGTDGDRRPVELRVADAAEDDGLGDAVVGIARDWRKAATHPNIVEVIDWGREPRPWVLTAAPPPTLEDRRAALSDGALCSLVTDVTEALRNAGLYNVTHGSLSPSTVRVSETTPPAALVDNWGLDAVVGDRQDGGYLTPYTAPERLDETITATADQTDVYGVAAVAYYALTGSTPFPADREAIAAGGLTPPAERRAEIPAAVSDLVVRALSVDPAERPDSPYRFGSRFEQAIGDWVSPPAAGPPDVATGGTDGSATDSADSGADDGEREQSDAPAEEQSDAPAEGTTANVSDAADDDASDDDTGGGSSRRALLAAMVGGTVVGAGAVGWAAADGRTLRLPWEEPHPDSATVPEAGGGGSGSGDGGSVGDDGDSGDGDTARIDPAVREEVDEYLSGVGNYDDDIADGTGLARAPVYVGVDNNGGPYGFDPPAVRVDRGATVVWQWVGTDSGHSVVAEDGAFESRLIEAEGAQFEWTATEPGVYPYYCAPHEALEMRGAVVVTDEQAPTPEPTPTPTPRTGEPFDGMPTEGYGPARTGHAPDETRPTGRVTEAWTADVGGGVRTTPIVVDDTVYVGTVENRVTALSAFDGTEQWTATVEAPVEATPTVVGDTVYVGTNEGTVAALSTADGERQWGFDAAGPIFGSPAVVDGTLYVADEDNGAVFAIATADRTDEWIRELEHPILGAPAVVDGTVYLGRVDGTVAALATADGSDRWTTTFERQIPVLAATPVRDGRVYAADLEGSVHALATADGTEQWRFEVEEEIRVSPAITGERVYAGTFGGSVYALSAADGTEQWRFDTEREVFASPTVADGTVHVGDVDGTVYGLAATDGTERWRFGTGSPVLGEPAVVDGRVFVGTEGGTVHALDGE